MADRKLFVGNLVRRIIQDDLWELYARYGPLEECAKFHESFGFVRFVYAEDARHALDDTRHKILKGRPIKVEYAAATNACRSVQPTCPNQRCSNGKTVHWPEPRKSCLVAIDRRYIPPLRAVDLPSYGGPYCDLSLVLPPSEFTPLPVHSTDHRRKHLSATNMNAHPPIVTFILQIIVNPKHWPSILTNTGIPVHRTPRPLHPTLLHWPISQRSMTTIVIVTVVFTTDPNRQSWRRRHRRRRRRRVESQTYCRAIHRSLIKSTSG